MKTGNKRPTPSRPRTNSPYKDITPVLVEWGDAWVGDSLGFVTAEDASQEDALLVLSVGHLLSSTEKGVVICRETCETGSNRGVQFIPRTCIRKVTKL